MATMSTMWEQSFHDGCVVSYRQLVRFWGGFEVFVQSSPRTWRDHVGWYEWSTAKNWIGEEGGKRWRDCQKDHLRLNVNHICPGCTYGFSWDRPTEWMLV